MTMVHPDYELLKSNELFGFLHVDKEGKILDVNNFYCTLIHYSPEELLTKTVFELEIEPRGEKELARFMAQDKQGSRLLKYKQVTKKGHLLELKTNILFNSTNSTYVLIIQDITETYKHSPTLNLNNNEQKIRHALDASNGGIWEWAPQSDTHFWSDRAYTMLGFSPGEFLINRNKLAQLLHPDERVFLFKSGINEFIKFGDNRFSVVMRLKCKDGTWKRIISRGKAVEFDRTGLPTLFIGTHIDLKEPAVKLSPGIRYYDYQYDYNNLWEHWTDTDGTIVYASPSCERITGYSADEFISDPDLLKKIIYPDDYDIWNLHYRDSPPEHPVETKFRIVRKDGELRWIHNSCICITDRRNRKLGYRISNRDITGYQKSIETTRELSGIIERCPLSIVITNSEERIEFVNRRALEVTGFHLNELISRKTREIVDSAIFDEIRQTITSGKVWSGEFSTIKSSSKNIQAKLKLSRILNKSGDISNFIIIGEDITDSEENRYIRPVDNRTGKPSSAGTFVRNEPDSNNSETELVSQASHEFRTPLASISSSAQMIKRYIQRWNEDKLKEHSNRIYQSVCNLNELIDNITTINQSISGNILVQKENINFIHWINRVMDNCNPLLRSGQSIIHRTKIKPRKLKLDANLMHRIVSNLLINAIKYSKENNTILIISSIDKGNLVISVRDDGIGISKYDIPYIFDSFFRAENVGKIKGTGLGLCIVKKTIEILNGKIFVESKPNAGSTFTITVPVD